MTGINIVGIRYEDMVNDPQRAFAAIFDHCGLPHNTKAVEGAFSRDSQRDSPLSMKNLGKYQVDGFTDEVKRQTDGVCDFFKVNHCFTFAEISISNISISNIVK